MTLIDTMRQNPGLAIRCRWVENPSDRDARHAKGGWGLFGAGGVIGTTADVREALAAGLLRPVSEPEPCPEGWSIERNHYMLAR